MIVGIHQPNYLPALTYFGKIVASDCLVFLDTVQFTKRNWTNRTRIKGHDGAQLLSVPVFTKGRYHQTVEEVRIADDPHWSDKHRRALQINYGKSRFFEPYFPAIDALLADPPELIHELNVRLIVEICGLLGIERRFERASELPETDLAGGDLLRFLTDAVGGEVYLSGQGGKKYLSEGQFPPGKVWYTRYEPVEYEQQFGEFVGNLSVLDVLFNEGDNAVSIIEQSVGVEHDDG